MAQYTIKSDDYKGFSGIAQKYGQTNWNAIQSLNPGIDTHKLRVDQVINIPDSWAGKSGNTASSNQPAQPAAPVDTRSDAQKYVDELTSIFNAPPEAFSKTNPFSNYFNEDSANQVAHQDVDPFFDNQVKNYLEDFNFNVGTTNRDANQRQEQLDTNKTNFSTDWNLNKEDATRGINNNYANGGAFFSGGRGTALNRSDMTFDQKMKEFLDQYGFDSRTVENNRQDALHTLDINKQRTLDPTWGTLTQERQKALQGDILNQKDEALQNQQLDAKSYMDNFFNSQNAKIDALTRQYGMDPTYALTAKNNLYNKYSSLYNV